MASVRTAAANLAGLALLLFGAERILSLGARSQVTAPRLFIVTYVGLFLLVVGGVGLLAWPWLRRGEE